MDKLLLAEQTAKAVDNVVATPSSGLLIHGPSGSGKQFLALNIAGRILKVSEASLKSYPYLIVVKPEEGKDSISIDQVRQVQSQLSRVVPGQAAVRRLVMITEAARLTPEAQNALLKSLEEPPADTIFILCAEHPSQLLPTVVSRAQTLPVLPVSETTAAAHFGNSPEFKRNFMISGGRVGLLQALMTDESHPLLAAIDQAKELLQQDPYKRLLKVNELLKNKEMVSRLLDALALVSHASLKAAVKAGNTKSAKQWQKVNRSNSQAQKALKANASPKLVLTDLFLQL